MLRIGTRESPLAVWQAKQVQQLLLQSNIVSELIYIKSEGDQDVVTPLYALGVQGIFTKALDAALLNNRIDIAVHSLKDIPVQIAEGIVQAAVLKRGSYKDVFVYKDESDLEKIGCVNGEWLSVNRESSSVDKQSNETDSNNNAGSFTIHDLQLTIATSSIRRIAQWLNRYPHTRIENLRGNVNTRLNKVNNNNWNGAIFAAAGLERINLRPEKAIDLDWMLPAPAQGAIAVVCRKDDAAAFNACNFFNDESTALCVKIERDFLRALLGGCSTPISGLAEVGDNEIIFKGNVLSIDGKQKIGIEKTSLKKDAENLGMVAGEEMLLKGADKIIKQIRNTLG